MAKQIVVAFRMSPPGMTPGPEGTYLQRARSLCSRGEALGGKLVAWSAVALAMAWDTDEIEQAIGLLTTIRGEAKTAERAWAVGVAEGDVEELLPQRAQLAWGEALLQATALSRVAHAGEALLDGNVGAVRAGKLSLVGARASSGDGGRRARGWQLDLARPWKGAPDDPGFFVFPRTLEPQADVPSWRGPAQFTHEEFSSAEVLRIVEAAEPPPMSRADVAAERRESARVPEGTLVDRVRKLARGEGGPEAFEVLADMRRARAAADGASPLVRCQTSLALGLTLSIAGRPEEALLETIDALGRAREQDHAKAVGACLALLSKLYAQAGHPLAAARLRDAAVG